MTETKFSWDFDVLDTPFWADMSFTDARNFLNCFTEDENKAMSFDGTLSKDAKYELLLSRLQQKLDRREAEVSPTPFYEVDYDAYSDLKLGLYTMNSGLNRVPECEAILTERIALDIDKIAPRNMLASVREKQGRYAEAETLGREVLPLLQNSPRLGVDSPQAFGTTRRIIAAVWKQGRYDEANKMVEDYLKLVDNMGTSKFVKYQNDEREELDKLMVELKHWREGKEAGGNVA